MLSLLLSTCSTTTLYPIMPFFTSHFINSLSYQKHLTMDAKNGCQMIRLDCWVESENSVGLHFFARLPPYRDFKWYVYPMCLDRRGNTSNTGRGGVTRENTTIEDSGGYVVGLHISPSTRVCGSLVIGVKVGL